MKVIQQFQSLRPAIQRCVHELDLNKVTKPFNVVFDIDDTIIFDNGRSTPNLQVVELLKKLKAKGAKIHLVTARDQESRQETILELKRSKIEYDSLELASSKARESLVGVAKFKHAMRKKYGPVLLSVGDQWTDFYTISSEDELEYLDGLHETHKYPWILVKLNDKTTSFGLKLMAND